jgi:Ribbon-helix-helix protein, copG family.
VPKTLTIELPDEVYAVLEELAAEEGKSVQELGAEWLTAMIARILDDPLEQVIGTIKVGIPNWSERHDELLGAYLRQKVKGASENAGA